MLRERKQSKYKNKIVSFHGLLMITKEIGIENNKIIILFASNLGFRLVQVSHGGGKAPGGHIIESSTLTSACARTQMINKKFSQSGIFFSLLKVRTDPKKNKKTIPKEGTKRHNRDEQPHPIYKARPIQKLRQANKQKQNPI